METVSCRLAVLSMLVAMASAVGPVMNQQPTIFDLIQNDPDLSEVNEYNSTFLVSNHKRWWIKENRL